MVLGLMFDLVFVGLGSLAETTVTVMFASAAVLTALKGLSFRRSRIEKLATRRTILEEGREPH
jgi:hypothetical protein